MGSKKTTEKQVSNALSMADAIIMAHGDNGVENAAYLRARQPLLDICAGNEALFVPVRAHLRASLKDRQVLDSLEEAEDVIYDLLHQLDVHRSGSFGYKREEREALGIIDLIVTDYSGVSENNRDFQRVKRNLIVMADNNDGIRTLVESELLSNLRNESVITGNPGSALKICDLLYSFGYPNLYSELDHLPVEWINDESELNALRKLKEIVGRIQSGEAKVTEKKPSVSVNQVEAVIGCFVINQAFLVPGTNESLDSFDALSKLYQDHKGDPISERVIQKLEYLLEDEETLQRQGVAARICGFLEFNECTSSVSSLEAALSSGFLDKADVVLFTNAISKLNQVECQKQEALKEQHLNEYMQKISPQQEKNKQ